MRREHSLSLFAVVPVCIIRQAAVVWGLSYKAAALKLGDFERQGFVRSVSIATRLFDPPTAPLYVHPPGARIERDLCRELSATFRSRYRKAKVVPLRMFVATAKALNILGFGDVKPSTAFTATHDILSTDVFIANRHRGTYRAEPQPPGGRRNAEKQPDAGIFAPDGTPEVFIEIAGSYRPERVEALLEYSNGSGVPLELWQ